MTAAEKPCGQPGANAYREAMRALDPGLDPEVVALIDERLDRVADEQGVAVLWAIESGSLRWPAMRRSASGCDPALRPAAALH